MTTQAVHKPHLNNRCLGASFPPSIIHRTRATFIHVHGGTMNKRNIQRRSPNQRLITMCSLTGLAYRFHQEWPSKGCNAYNGIVSVMKGNNKNADSDATLIYIIINKCTHMNSIFVENIFFLLQGFNILLHDILTLLYRISLFCPLSTLEMPYRQNE